MPGFSRFWALEYSAGGGPATRAFTQRLGACLGWLGGHAGLSPNHLTFLSLITSAGASLLFATLASGWASVLACAVLYQLAYGFDCADGQLARATGNGSAFGAWLDVSVDTVSVVALSFGVLYWLGSQTQLLGLASICLAILTLGRILALYSSHSLRSEPAPRENRIFELRANIKTLLWLVFDTPVFLLGVCLLRDAPALLLAYTLGMGTIYSAKAIYGGLRMRAQ